MNILDENIPRGQRKRLQDWGFRMRQIGYDIGRLGMQDTEILPLLHRQHNTTLFTLDSDFYKPNLCHTAYCLVYLIVLEEEIPDYIRRVLRHHDLNTVAKRMGLVIRVTPAGLTVWRPNAMRETALAWHT